MNRSGTKIVVNKKQDRVHSESKLLAALRQIAAYRPQPQARCGGCVHFIKDIAKRTIADVETADKA